MQETIGELVTTIIHNEENTKTFEVRRDFKGVDGEEVILLQLFPTLGHGDEFSMDSTNRHLIEHRKELNISTVRFINLFATRCNARLSTRNIEIDTENIEYIESIMSDKNFKKCRFVVAFGCSMKNCAVAEETKNRIFAMFEKYNKNGKIYQITVDDLDSKNDVAVHVLFLGIRHSNSIWRYEEFKIPKMERNGALKIVVEKENAK